LFDFKKLRDLPWLRLFYLLLFIAGTTLLLYITGLIQLFLDKERLVNFLNELGPFAFLGFIFLQVCQVVAAPIPGEVTGLLGGFMFGKAKGIILSTIGLTLGSFLAFTLSRKFGRPFVEKVVSAPTLERFDYLLRNKGAFIVFLLFLIPGFPKDYLCYVLGLGHLSTAEFLVIGGTGRLLGTTMLTFGGDFLRHEEYFKFFILTGAALIVILIALAYRDKLERLFRMWHISQYRKKKAKRNKQNE
jgi:uncharacterized membrane protein YdjX (TVP38/TMEM64 family)